jgi:hypothetical protein
MGSGDVVVIVTNAFSGAFRSTYSGAFPSVYGIYVWSRITQRNLPRNPFTFANVWALAGVAIINPKP